MDKLNKEQIHKLILELVNKEYDYKDFNYFLIEILSKSDSIFEDLINIKRKREEQLENELRELNLQSTNLLALQSNIFKGKKKKEKELFFNQILDWFRNPKRLLKPTLLFKEFNLD